MKVYLQVDLFESIRVPDLNLAILEPQHHIPLVKMWHLDFGDFTFEFLGLTRNLKPRKVYSHQRFVEKADYFTGANCGVVVKLEEVVFGELAAVTGTKPFKEIFFQHFSSSYMFQKLVCFMPVLLNPAIYIILKFFGIVLFEMVHD